MKKKMNSPLLLIIDGENLLHRAYHKFLGFKSQEGKPTGAIYGFLKILHSNIYRFNPDSVVVTFDNGRSKHRLDVLPDYKAGRSKLGMDYDSLQLQKRVIKRTLKRLRVPHIFDKKFVNNYEADDYIAWMVNNYPGKVVILSSDKDFHQLINERVKVMSPSKDILITEKNCKSLTGYNPEQCVDWLSMVGDNSDNIPGYRGIGEKGATQLLEKYVSMNKFLNSNSKEGRIDKELFKEVMEKNRLLIDLAFFTKSFKLKPNEIPIYYGKKKLDKAKLVREFNKYSLSSFQSDEFLNQFKNLKIWTIK